MANVMYFCINKWHWTPSQVFTMTEKEKAVIIACVQTRIAAEEKSRAETEQLRR